MSSPWTTTFSLHVLYALTLCGLVRLICDGVSLIGINLSFWPSLFLFPVFLIWFQVGCDGRCCGVYNNPLCTRPDCVANRRELELCIQVVQNDDDDDDDDHDHVIFNVNWLPTEYERRLREGVFGPRAQLEAELALSWAAEDVWRN
jgi:hypothetical protein